MRAMTALQYRQEAERVRRLAEAAASEGIRQQLLEIARQYEALGADLAAAGETRARERPNC